VANDRAPIAILQAYTGIKYAGLTLVKRAPLKIRRDDWRTGRTNALSHFLIDYL